MTTFGVRYTSGMIIPATNRNQAERVASNLGGRVVVIVEIEDFDREAQGLHPESEPAARRNHAE